MNLTTIIDDTLHTCKFLKLFFFNFRLALVDRFTEENLFITKLYSLDVPYNYRFYNAKKHIRYVIITVNVSAAYNCKCKTKLHF